MQPKVSVVSKKISVENQSKAEKKGSPVQVETSAKKLDAGDVIEKETSVVKRIYDPKNRINPFTPLFKGNNKEVVANKSSIKKRKKRIPQTPLERIGINQLKLRAIIRAASGNRALVEDNSGKGYIIKKGTYVGLNSGIVTQINANHLIVEEELENLMGEVVLQNTKIKLQKPAGE